MFHNLKLRVSISSVRIAAVLLLTVLAYGQYETAAVLGTVTDPGGRQYLECELRTVRTTFAGRQIQFALKLLF